MVLDSFGIRAKVGDHQEGISMSKEDIIQDAISCLEDIVYECVSAKRNEPDQYNSLATCIEQSARGNVKRLQRLVEQEQQETIRKAFNIP